MVGKERDREDYAHLQDDIINANALELMLLTLRHLCPEFSRLISVLSWWKNALVLHELCSSLFNKAVLGQGSNTLALFSITNANTYCGRSIPTNIQLNTFIKILFPMYGLGSTVLGFTLYDIYSTAECISSYQHLFLDLYLSLYPSWAGSWCLHRTKLLRPLLEAHVRQFQCNPGAERCSSRTLHKNCSSQREDISCAPLA